MYAMRQPSIFITGIALVAALAACGGGGGSGPITNPPVGGPSPTTAPPTTQGCAPASGALPTSGVYGCVHVLASANPQATNQAPNGWVVPGANGLATQDVGVPTTTFHVYIGGVYHDPLHQPTGSIAVTTDANGFFASNDPALMADLKASTAYYGATDKSGTPYALVEATQYALAPPCTAPVVNAGQPSANAPLGPNVYPATACGVAMPAPMPSPVPGGYSVDEQLFPYTASASSAQFVQGFLPTAKTGTGWGPTTPLYVTTLTSDEATMFDGAETYRMANEASGVGYASNALGAWDGTPIVPDETEMELARYNAWSYGTTGQDGLGGLLAGSSLVGLQTGSFYGAPGAEGPYAIPIAQQGSILVSQMLTAGRGLMLNSPCRNGVPTDVTACAVPAQLGYFHGFASLYNGAAPSFAPNQGPSNYFDNEASSPH